MRALRVSLLAFVATGVLLGVSGGAVQVRTTAAQTQTQHLVDTPAIRPVAGGQYCRDVSGGEVFIANNAPSAGLYCAPDLPPAFVAPAFDPNWVPVFDQGET